MSRRTEAEAVAEQPTPPRQPVSVKGSGDGLRITVSRDDPTTIEASLRQHLAQRSGAFFGGATVSLEMPSGPLDIELAARLSQIIQASGLRIVRIVTADGERQEQRAVAESALPAPVGALIVETTLRSGQRIAHGGSVVVLGDLNPGAEVLAGESVIVWGRLRGMVEAGLSRGPDEVGDIVVCALDLAPTQLRIGRAIARAPEEPARVPVPEVARAREGQIEVDAWR
jgi:septum site-determining protein MinC